MVKPEDSDQEYQVRVLIADDDVDTRVILSDYLAHFDYKPFVVCNGEEAMALAAIHPLDIAIVDIVMPGLSGTELAVQLKELQPELEVILITAFGCTELAVEAMHQGVFYYLDKPLDLKQLGTIAEKAWVARRTRAQILAGETSDLLNTIEDLTVREKEVLTLLAGGKTNPEIAEELKISIHTACNHTRHILSKLGVPNRVQAAVLWDRYTRRQATRTSDHQIPSEND